MHRRLFLDLGIHLHFSQQNKYNPEQVEPFKKKLFEGNSSL